MVKYYETQTMELKEKYTDSIAKEIVSFLNSDGGTLIVGVKDDGTVVGVDKLDETLRKISDVITGQIEPNPQDEITTEVRFDEKKALIVLNISKGVRNIYCQTLTLTNQDAVIYGDELKLPKTKQRLRIRKRHSARLQEVKVCPVSGGYDILLVYQVKEPSAETGTHSVAVDFGVDNTMAVVADTGDSIIFKGEYIKSINQYFMKKKAERISLMNRGKETTECVWSKYLDRLSAYRTSYIRDCFHKMSKKLLVWCQRNDIGYLVLGSNAFWKQNSSIGTVNNQNFVSIPFEMLKSMIELKACEYGVTVVRNEESYTSKASFLDLDFVPVYSEEEPDKKYHFSGRRIQRGLYKSADGTLINADINGAANILRKAGYNVSNIKIARLLNPTIIHFKDLNCK